MYTLILGSNIGINARRKIHSNALILSETISYITHKAACFENSEILFFKIPIVSQKSLRLIIFFDYPPSGPIDNVGPSGSHPEKIDSSLLITVE